MFYHFNTDFITFKLQRLEPEMCDAYEQRVVNHALLSGMKHMVNNLKVL